MKRLVPYALSAVLLAGTSCHLFSKKKAPPTPKDNPNVAIDVEKDFMKRWIDKRTVDLVTQGKTPEQAHLQALAEFKAAYGYTDAARQAK
jgi:hypothetical protein